MMLHFICWSMFTTTPEPSVLRELEAVKTAVVHAYRDLDAEALESLYTDDFTVTDAQGRSRTKTDELAWVRAAKHPALLGGSYTLLHVRVYGDIAVASGRAELTVPSPEGPRPHRYTSVNVFRREKGRWRYAASFTP